MSNEMTENKKPVVMNVSSFSNIAQKLNFLAMGIKNQEDAENRELYIECYTSNDGNQMIRLSTDLIVWTELSPYDSKEGELLPKNISVNLFDLYNVLEICKDDIISFWIDEDDISNPELVINTFHNEVTGLDQIEVRLKIIEIGFPIRTLVPELYAVRDTFILDNIGLYSVIAELNVENLADGVNICIKNKEIFFQTQYNGYNVSLTLKNQQPVKCDNDFKVFIPFYVFNLMSATGQITDVIFKILPDDKILLEAKDYSFLYQIEEEVDVFDFEDEKEQLKEFSVAKPLDVVYCVQLLNKINTPADVSMATIKKFDDMTGEITVSNEGRYKASVLAVMAMLSDEEIYIDSYILSHIFDKTNVDAMKVQYNPSTKNIYIKYENALMTKEMFYNHTEFLEYRQSCVKKEK